MVLKMQRSRWQAVTVVLLLVVAGPASAGWRDDIGHTRLSAELGGGLPTGTNITVSHIEAPEVPGNYMPNTNHVEFVGKVFTNVSGLSNGVSTHATTVGLYLYGTNTSIAPDINTIDNHDVNGWLNLDFLRAGTPAEPVVETRRIQNHSWVGGSSNPTGVVRRLDFAIDRDGFVAVVGANNGASTNLPDLLVHSYNAIVVGRSDGAHSAGETTFDEPGRRKPDIVVPAGATSWATPVVASAAALLLEVSDTNAALTNAGMPQCVKALLLAGATKEEFPAWDRTPARPLDEVYGAGELSIYHSYHTLIGGEQEASTTSKIARLGWDYASIAAGSNRWYFFEVPESNVMTRLSAVLTWHRAVPDEDPGPSWLPGSFVANLALRLYSSTNLVAGPLLDSSTSTVDNVEHIYQRHLVAGQYALEVSSDSTTNYAIAWFSRTVLIPEIEKTLFTNNLFRFEARVSPDVSHVVEVSTNLLFAGGWTSVSTNTSTTNVLAYEDAATTNFVRRFYRLVPDP